MGKLDGKIAIVSGAGRGIGRSIALKLAAEGASVVVNDLDATPADEVVKEITGAGGSAVACPGSVSAADFGERFVGAATAPVNIDQETIDISHDFNTKDRIHGYYAFQKDLRGEPILQGDTIPGFGDTRQSHRQIGTINETHTFGANLCPDTAGLDPVTDRKSIEDRLLKSRVGALLAYLKTL